MFSLLLSLKYVLFSTRQIDKDSFLFRYNEDDQTNLEELIRTWSPDNHVMFRRCNPDTNSKLLLVHQTDQQRRLLERYGSELTCLDATYRTMQYAVPLFFVVVKTNIDYQVRYFGHISKNRLLRNNYSF